jgi:hypothetical protein
MPDMMAWLEDLRAAAEDPTTPASVRAAALRWLDANARFRTWSIEMKTGQRDSDMLLEELFVLDDAYWRVVECWKAYTLDRSTGSSLEAALGEASDLMEATLRKELGG